MTKVRSIQALAIFAGMAMLVAGFVATAPPAMADSGKNANARVGEAADISFMPAISSAQFMLTTTELAFALTQGADDLDQTAIDVDTSVFAIAADHHDHFALRPPDIVGITTANMMMKKLTTTSYRAIMMLGDLTPTVGGPSVDNDFSGATAIAAADTPVDTTHAPPVHLRI